MSGFASARLAVQQIKALGLMTGQGGDGERSGRLLMRL